MSPLLSCLLLAIMFDLYPAYNMYKDLQRGKVEDLERLITDEIHSVDQSDQTWPSVGAKVQMSNSDKRTINRFKNLKSASEFAREDIEDDQIDPQTVRQGTGEEDMVATRIHIPRTHVLLREGEVKLKRGSMYWDLGLTANPGLVRNIIWIFKTKRFVPQNSLIGLNNNSGPFSDRCKKFGDYYRCT